MTAFAKLLEPTTLGRLRLRNRMVMAPMEVDYGSDQGLVTPRTIAHYQERARGGVGLVIVEATCVESKAGRLSPHQLVIDSDAAVPPFQRLVRAVQAQGAAIVLQLNHAGRKTTSLVTGHPPVAPSPIVNQFGETPRELSREEIAQLVELYAAAAARAAAAGFDGVELHAAHGYLGAQFLSPRYNRRQDEYGGSVEGRARFVLEVVAAMRQRVGRDFPLLCRLSAVEYSAEAGRPEGEVLPLADGLTLEDTLATAELLEQAGVTALEVSSTLVGQPHMHPMSWPEGGLLASAAAVKERVSLPVIATSRIPPALAEETLRAGRADLIAFARPLLADPELPRKLALDDPRGAGAVVPCIFCNACLDPQVSAGGVRCAVNPAQGRERELRLQPAARKLKVAVVGGGAAGLTAARIASLRGHQVVLWESAASLGGSLNLTTGDALARRTQLELRDFLVHQAEELGVEVRLGQAADPESVLALAPDAVILATGQRLRPLDIPGVAMARPAREVLAGAATGQRVAVLGAEQVGCEAALLLAEQGKEVALLTRRPKPAMQVESALAVYLQWALPARGVSVHARVQVDEITAGSVTFTTRRGERRQLEVDTVLLATGGEPDLDLVHGLEGRVPRLLKAGSCNGTRGLTAAIDEGYRAAFEL